MILGIMMTFFGYAAISPFFKENVLKKISLGYLIGFGLTTIPLFLLTYFHVRLSQQIIIYLLLGLMTISTLALLLSKERKINIDKLLIFVRKLTPTQWILVTLILIGILASFIINWYWPVTAWDSVTLYDFRAKLYAEGGLLIDLWRNMEFASSQVSYYYSYPPLTSLAHALGYFVRDSHISVLYSFFFLSLILLFFTEVYKKASLSFALILTALLATNFTLFSHSLLAYTNLPYAVYIVAAFFTLYQFAKTKEIKYFILGTALSSVAVLIRAVDPFPFFLPVVFIPLVAKNRRFVIHFALFILILYAARVFTYSHFKNDLAFLSVDPPSQANTRSVPAIIETLSNVGRYKEVITYVYSALEKYHFHLLLFALSFILFKKKRWTLAVFIIASVLILIPGTLILSITYEGWNRIPDSIHRLMFFLYPLIYYYFSCMPELNNLFSLPTKKGR